VAEFLVFDKNHWMDMLNAADIEQMRARYPKTWDEKYLARYRRGDIIEVRPDGYWTGPKALKFNREAFKIVCVPGVAPNPSFAESKVHVRMVPEAGTGKLMSQETLLKRSRWRFPTTPSGKIVTLPTMSAVQA